MFILKYILCILFGFSAGLVISGAVFAFISVIGVVSRLAQKTHTSNYIKIYEEAIMIGGLLGTLPMVFDLKLPIGNLAVILFSICIGIFFGSLAVSLAEVLNVIPILTRRARIQQGMFWFVLALALGKLLGSLMYYVVPGFFGEM